MDSILTMTGNAPHKGLGKDLLKIILISCFFVGIAIVLQNDTFRARLIDIALLRVLLVEKTVNSDHIWRQALLFVVAFSLLIGVGLPRLWVSALAGAAFGTLGGTLLALAASVAGAAIVYQLGRTLLAGLLRRRIGPRLAEWQAHFETNAFWWVLYMRLFPLSNATLAGLLCGACRIGVGPYLVGSLMGFVPLTVVFAVFGSGGARGNFYQLALGSLLLAAAVGGRALLARFIPSRLRLMQKKGATA